MAKRTVETGGSQVAPSGEVKKRRVSSNKLPTVSTDFHGVHLITRVEGVKPDILRKTTGELVDAARAYVVLYPALQAAKQALGPSEKTIRTIVGETEGLRGVEVDEEFRLPVSVPETIVWDRDQLRTGVGEHYQQVVKKETATITVELDPTFGIEPAVLLAAVGLVMGFYGVPPEQAKARLGLKVELDVDEPVLVRLQKSGTIILTDGARTVRKGTPSINQPTILQAEDATPK